MDFGSDKNTVVTAGQQLKNSQGSIGVVEKIVQEFIFVRFPDGTRRMRRSSVGKELFVIQPLTPAKPVQENRVPPPFDVIPERKRIMDRRLVAEQSATEAKFTYSDLSDISTVDIDIRRITGAYKRHPISQAATTDKRVELSLERRYHGGVSSALDEMYLRETKRIGESIDMEKQAYEELRGICKEERESGYDPMSRDGIILGPTDYISVKLKRENAERMARTAHRKMKEIDETRKKPYFARIDCGPSVDDIHTVYIGDTAIQNLVTDWRDKYIGNVFYYSGILKDAEGIFIALKRHITFDNQILTQYVDEINSYIGMTLIPQTAEDKKYISDELLMRLLEESRSQQSVHDIIRSIQQNQYTTSIRRFLTTA